jgi:hypothetical protein
MYVRENRWHEYSGHLQNVLLALPREDTSKTKYMTGLIFDGQSHC